MAIGMAGLALALTAAGAGLKAVQTVRAGNAEAEAGRRERESAESAATLSDYNAAVAELQAKDAVARGVEDENRFRSQVRGIIGRQRAGFAAGSIQVNQGSAVDVQEDAAFLGELDALTIRTNAAREAWGYEVQAEDSRRRATIQRKEGVNLELAGNQARSASRWAAAGSLVGTGATLLMAKYGFGGRS